MKSNFYLLFCVLLMLGSVNVSAQIGIGTKTPAASAALEVSSSTNNKGILIPRLSATQKDAIVNPAEGLLVYQTTAPTGFYYYSGTAWKLMANATDLSAAGNAGTATKLAASKNINGVAFDGSADITVPAAAETLTGIVAIANGGTNSAAAATAGGIGYGTGTAHAYTGAGTSGQLLSSNGAGVPTWITPSSGGIPYTGATAAVDLGAYDLKVNSLTVGKGGGNKGSNTAIGNAALYYNTTGNNNTANGQYALVSNTTGSYNIANGMQALYSNTTGSGNTASGMQVLYTNTTGSSNTANGLNALFYNTTGSSNTAHGNTALFSNTTGANNTAIGSNADVTSGILTNATAIGAGAKVSASNTIQLGNTAVTNLKTSGTITAGAVTYPKTDGTAGQVLTSNANGIPTWAAASGADAATITGIVPVANGGTGTNSVPGILSALGFASNNVAIGSVAGTPNQGVNANTIAIGGGAGRKNQGASSVAIGYVSGDQNQGANSISIGGNAAQGNQGTQAVAIGFAAGQNGQGANSVAIGTFAGQSGQAANSIAINATGTSTPLNPTTTGFFVDPIINRTATSTALYYNTTTKEITSGTAASGGVPYTGATGAVNLGNYDLTVNGITAGMGSGNLGFNTVFGRGALSSTALTNGGNYNLATGYVALQSNTTGSFNTATGTYSLLKNTTGINNTGYGVSSLFNNTTGNNNTAIGYEADVVSNNLSNATAIGYGAKVATDNTIQLGNTAVTNVKTSGTITAGAVTYPKVDGSNGQVLTTNGAGVPTWTTPSGGGGGVPYTGATSAVNLGAYDLTVNGIKVGKGAGNVSTNTAVGDNALSSNTGGGFNTAVGTGALQTNLTGGFNTSVGTNALLYNKGNYNIAVGSAALQNNTSGESNTAMGFVSNTSNTTGSKNTSFGNSALTTNTTGSNNTAIGAESNVFANNLSNATAIGYQAVVAASNSIQLGNTNVTNVKTSGTLTAGAVTYPRVDGTANQMLTTNGSGVASWTSPSTSILYQKTGNSLILTNTVQNLISLSLPAGSYLVTYTGKAYKQLDGPEYVASRIAITSPGNMGGSDAINVDGAVNDGRAYVVHQLGITLATAGSVSVYANNIYGTTDTYLLGSRLVAVQVGSVIDQ